jgi:tetratricopeptide (TPR) repeat protein
MDTTKDEVQAREGTLVLPTYAIKGENRNPVFHSRYGVAHIYPYTMLDDIDNERKEKTYHTVELENKFLRVTVITDLGGRVYSVFDKISNCEVFYKNPVVRFAPLAIRGAFFSGGVEFSFPVAHAPTTCDKVNWNLRRNEDGSASISMGGLEHISGLRWVITLTLFPGRCALAQDVYLYNSGTIPGRYHYWTNASLDANDGTEFIYPLQRARSYEYAGTASWPYARLDLIQQDPGLPGMEGVPMWPAARMLAPVNFRWQKNMLAQVSIFGRQVSWDYFGAWQHRTDRGYAHVASSRDVSGMKLWSWGNAPVGVVNQTSLTNDGSVYAETQCGALETQLDFDFLTPGGKRSWREWWIPLREIGGLTCASETIGAKLSLKPIGDGESVCLTVALCPAQAYDDASVTLTVGHKVLLEGTCSMAPERPWRREITITSGEVADNPVSLVVRDSLGAILLQNTQDRTPNPTKMLEPSQDLLPTTADDFYALGVRHENLDNRQEARKAYQDALQVGEAHRDSHLRLGLILLRSGQFREADKHFLCAEQLGLIESSYYRGIVALNEARWSDAELCFAGAVESKSLAVAALLGRGKIALRNGDWDVAIRHFSQANDMSSEAVTPGTLLAAALRCADKPIEAYSVLQRVLARDPLNHPALNELAMGQYPESEAVREALQRMLADDDQYFVDLACFYIAAGLADAALRVLDAAWSYKDNAMIAYLGAYQSQQVGNAAAADAWLRKAAATSPDFGFPSRLEEVLALEWAIQQNSHDSKAKYFLGNFLYANQRYEEALRLWREALEGMGTYDVLHRNLGLGAWHHESNIPDAIQYFERTLALNPQNQDLYLYLDELYKSSSMQKERQNLLERIQSLTTIREDVHKHRIAMMVEFGHYQEALAMIAAEKFLPLEMDQSFHEVYVHALRLRANKHLEAGEIEEAIKDYRSMLEYPDNLGVGAPTTRAQADVFYELGLAYEKLGRYREAIASWREAASEHHPHGHSLFPYIQMALDKLGRYSELGLEG